VLEREKHSPRGNWKYFLREFTSTLPYLSRDGEPINTRRACAAFWDGFIAVQNRLHPPESHPKSVGGEITYFRLMNLLFPASIP